MASALDLAVAPSSDVVTDRELLDAFRSAGDQESFARLVERYRGLVLGTCRRIVRNAADAEDAFQATFLVLAKKVDDLRWQTSIGGWLHETARRTALKLVERRSRAARRDRVAGDRQTGRADEPRSIEDVAAIVDDELSKLPEKFREPLALVLFEELSRQETAGRLGLSESAVKDRLERGRELLRSRLVARGVTASAAALTTWLSAGAATAAASPTLVSATVPAATAFASGQAMAGLASASALSLAQGVLSMSAFAKLKTGLAAAVLFAVAGVALAALVPAPDRFEKGLRGRVEAVDVAGAPQKITVKLDEFDILLSLDVALDAKVFLAYERGTLGSLGKGAFVSLRLADDHRTVKEIHALGTTHDVKIASIDAAKGIVVGDVDDDDDDNAAPKRVEFSIAKDAILSIGELPARLSQFHPGLRARLELGKDGKTIHGIEGRIDDERTVSGRVKGVEPGKGVTLLIDKEDDETELLVKIATGALIRLDGKDVEMGAIPVGSSVRGRLTADGVSLEAIVARSPEKDDD